MTVESQTHKRGQNVGEMQRLLGTAPSDSMEQRFEATWRADLWEACVWLGGAHQRAASVSADWHSTIVSSRSP